MRIALVAIAAAALAGCASVPDATPAEKLALYRAHAGAPVSNFAYSRPFMQWMPLGDAALAVWISPSRAYLLEVGACPDLDSAPGIRLSDSSGLVVARLDRVYPIGPAVHPVPCRIDQIRPLDVGALRESERAKRDEPRT